MAELLTYCNCVNPCCTYIFTGVNLEPAKNLTFYILSRYNNYIYIIVYCFFICINLELLQDLIINYCRFLNWSLSSGRLVFLETFIF